MHIALAYRFISIENKPALAIVPGIGFLLTGAIWYGLDIFAKEVGIVGRFMGIVYLACITRSFKVKKDTAC